MGCHTWFSRPITEKEFQLMKEYAPIEMLNLIGKTKENIETGIYDEVMYDLLMKSYQRNIPCVYGKYWWQYGWGGGNPELVDEKCNDYFRVRQIRGEKGLFVDVMKYHDIFRTGNYPSRVIHNRRELRRWMRKIYFELEEWQLEKIGYFFKENPGGVITFG